MADEQSGDRQGFLWWPLKWITDEKFWRDTVSGALSAVLAALVIWVVGVLLGYFQNPQWQKDSLPVLWWATIALAAGLILMCVVALIWPRNMGQEDKKNTAKTLIIMLSGLPLLVYGLLQA
jgi:uncharacterized membrane protein YjfL (UPF0719 family)